MPASLLARLLGAPARPPLPCPAWAPAAVQAAAAGMLAAAALTWASLTFLTGPAPYGRHGRADPAAAASYGRGLPARLAWALQEAPAFLIPAAMALSASRRVGGPAALAAALGPQRTARLAAFLAHYGHRSLIYPLRIRGGARTPVGIAALAFAFCTYNGAMQGAALVWCGGGAGRQEASPLAFRAGMAAWAAGAALNLASDAALRRLRSRKGADGYYALPAGPLFAAVACPNYTGEALEWAGWAAAAGWSVPATAFAVYTLANLGPRARAHAAFYAARFPGQGWEGRAGLVPWVY